ncbi:hypothetical protein SLEP1_g9522 [Rubroshorea leprosula]|uniref:Myb-like domain-containing protein n=1 Tax=Rubroshorea leprosula TaxID=152421 RepID=A0AAV5I563_9ROSI|nr:hypothetical protein SLEP1_g9522 [Rubroshorea leprosula]
MALEQLASIPALNPVNGESAAVEEPRLPSGDGGENVGKAPRLPRWTRQEILVLIQGKRVAENRVRRGRAASLAFGSAVEPKWTSVSSYCKRHGVNRGPVQCRKRWSNLAGDFKKIKEWESNIRDEMESYWVMRNDLRKERKLPVFFDKEVYDILDSGGGPTVSTSSVAPGLTLALTPTPTSEDTETILDSGRCAAADDGLFSNFEKDEDGGSPEKVEQAAGSAVPVPIPISGAPKEKNATLNPEIGSTSQDGRKRKRFSTDADEEMSNLRHQLINVLERNGKTLTAQLESQNTNFQLDREQRKSHTDSLVDVLNKLADALGRIADKL